MHLSQAAPEVAFEGYNDVNLERNSQIRSQGSLVVGIVTRRCIDALYHDENYVTVQAIRSQPAFLIGACT